MWWTDKRTDGRTDTYIASRGKKTPFLMTLWSHHYRYNWQHNTMVCWPRFLLQSVAAGFGRHGMPPPAASGTGTALGQHGSDWSRDLATPTFNFGGHGACSWCGSSSSIRVPSLKFIGLAVRKIWRMMCAALMGLVTLIFDLLTLKLVCESHQRWGTFISNLGTLGLWVLQLFAMYATDGRTKPTLTAPFPTGGCIINTAAAAANSTDTHQNDVPIFSERCVVA